MMRTVAPAVLTLFVVLAGAWPAAASLRGPGLDFDQGVDASAALGSAREASSRLLSADSAGVHRSIFILKSSGICDGCAEAISKMLFTAGIRSQILGPEQLKGAVRPEDVVVVGGGIPDSDGEWTIKQALAKAGAFDWLKEHIAKGGRYVGICAGAYLTEKWIDQENGDRGLDIFPGDVDNYSKKDKSTKFLLTRWSARGAGRWVYFQDGPAFFPAKGAEIDVLATFARDGVPAAAVFPYGKGRVAVISPHLEADEDWAKQANLEDPDGLDYDLGIAVFRKVIE